MHPMASPFTLRTPVLPSGPKVFPEQRLSLLYTHPLFPVESHRWGREVSSVAT